MRLSRRRFLKSSLALTGISIIPPALLSSCLRSKGKSELITAFTGSRGNFDRYQPYFRKLSKSKFIFSSLEATLSGEADIAFFHPDSPNKSSYILLLLEQGKDILSSYPMGYTLGEYASISDFKDEYGRIIGMLNPLLFYPSIQMLKDSIIPTSGSLNEIRISCHPAQLHEDFRVAGLTGTAQLLQRMVSYLSGSYPRQLIAKGKDSGGTGNTEGSNGNSGISDIASIELDYETFNTYIRFDKNQIGWNMEIQGDDFMARCDHTGMLAVNNEVEPRLKPEPGVFEDSMLRNLEDFIQAVRDRKQPLVSSLDGLASILLNNAVEKSLKSDSVIDL